MKTLFLFCAFFVFSPSATAAPLVTLTFNLVARLSVCEPFDDKRVCTVGNQMLGMREVPLLEHKDAMGGTYLEGELLESPEFGSSNMHLRIVFFPLSYAPGMFAVNYLAGFSPNQDEMSRGMLEIKPGDHISVVELDTPMKQEGRNSVSVGLSLYDLELNSATVPLTGSGTVLMSR